MAMGDYTQTLNLNYKLNISPRKYTYIKTDMEPVRSTEPSTGNRENTPHKELLIPQGTRSEMNSQSKMTNLVRKFNTMTDSNQNHPVGEFTF